MISNKYLLKEREMNEIKKDRISNDSHFDMFEQLVTVNSKLKEEILIRKNTEINLLHSEEKYRSIINNMELGLVEVDNNDVIINANERLYEMTGYSNEELIGKEYIEIFLDNESKKVMEKQNANRKDGINGVYEVKLRKKNGDWLWIIISGAPLYDEEKNVMKSYAVFVSSNVRATCITMRRNGPQRS